MKRSFGDDYYADSAKTPNWHKADQHLAGKLEPLLKALDLDAPHRVKQVVDSWRQKIHTRLRAATQLGRSEAGGMKVDIEVTSKVPPPVLERLLALPEPLLWVLIHRQEIASTRRGLDAVRGQLGLLNGPGGFPGIGLGEQEIAPVADAFRKLDETAVRRADEEIQAILGLRGDVLGAYYYRRRPVQIELHWIVIWIIATRLRVATDDLALVVLVHEMAHFYTHQGQDADGDPWDTDAFHRADLNIAEGLAQFYTEVVLLQLAEAGNPKPMEAFEALFRNQPEPYQCFRQWVPRHKKRIEVVRRALVQARARGIGDYGHFLHLLDGGASDL